MALPVTIPNTFANATAAIPLSQLDANFNTLSNAVNGLNSGSETLANLKATTANVVTLTVTGNATIGDASTDTVTLNSTLTANTAVIFSAGTSAAPSITFTGDTNTGIFSPAADTIAFAEGGVEAMRIDSSGNLGLGVTPSNTSSSYRAIQIKSLNATTILTSDYSSQYATNAYWDGSAWQRGGNDYAPVLYNQFNGAHTFSTAAAAGTTITFTQAMKLDASGNLLVGTTSNTYSAAKGLISGGAGGGGTPVFSFENTDGGGDGSPLLGLYQTSSTTTSSARFIQFYASVTVTPMGGIVGNGASNVQFASISDVREKTNIQQISGSLEKVVALRPVEFDWIKNGEHCPAGFVAQDVEQVFPEFVIENFAQEGQEPRKGLTGGMTGGIVAHLVKAIQELKAELDTVKAELATLKG
jgi:hypothetical protein